MERRTRGLFFPLSLMEGNAKSLGLREQAAAGPGGDQ